MSKELAGSLPNIMLLIVLVIMMVMLGFANMAPGYTARQRMRIVLYAFLLLLTPLVVDTTLRAFAGTVNLAKIAILTASWGVVTLLGLASHYVYFWQVKGHLKRMRQGIRAQKTPPLLAWWYRVSLRFWGEDIPQQDDNDRHC